MILSTIIEFFGRYPDSEYQKFLQFFFVAGAISTAISRKGKG